MVFKGLLVLLSGFLFIFSSGIPMRLISRYKPDYRREGLYWGIAIWIGSFFLVTFLFTISRMIIKGSTETDNSEGPIIFFVSTLFTIFVTQFAMRLILKKEQKKSGDVIGLGLALGFGVGVISQVLTGMILITTGINIFLQGLGFLSPFSGLFAEMQTNVAEVNSLTLLPTLLSFILYRVSILVVCAAQGYLVSKSIIDNKKNFLYGMLIYLTFTWGYLLIQLILRDQHFNQISLGLTSSTTSIISIGYFLLSYFITSKWLDNGLSVFYKVKNRRN